MPTLDTFIVDISLIVIVAGLASLIFKKIKLPVVLGYILAGFLISPHFNWLPTVVEIGDINTWADIGIIFLMFALGLEFSFSKLAKVGSSAIITALTVIPCMIASGFLLARLLHFTLIDSMFLGCMVSMSSTMIILKAYEEYKVKKEKYATLVLGTLVVEDILGVFMMIVLSAFSISKDVSGTKMATQIGLLLLMLVVWLVLGLYIVPTFVKKTRKLMNDETLLIVSVAICFAMVAISHYIGFSDALGAFMAGSILAGTTSGIDIERVIKPIRDLFGAVFFVSVGMMIDPPLIIKYIIPIVVISVFTIFGQMIFSTLGIVLSGQSMHTAIKGGMSMVQIGEFSFILASLGKSLGVISDELYPVIVCVSIITIFTTPIFMKSSDRVYSFADRHAPAGIRNFFGRYTSDKRSGSDNTSEWLTYMKRYGARTAICSAMLYVIYYGSTRYILPFIVERAGQSGEIITSVIAIILMIPVMTVMLNIKSNSFKKLWLMSITNRLPLITLRTLRFIISAFFIVLTLQKILHIKYYFTLPIALVLVFILVKSEFFKGMAMGVEARLLANVNEKILHARKKENKNSWMGDKLFVVKVRVCGKDYNKKIKDVFASVVLDVFVLKILRDREHILLPGPEERVKEGDDLFVMSERPQLEGFVSALDSRVDAFETDKKIHSMREFIYGQKERDVAAKDQIMCCVIPMTKEAGFVGSSIKNSDFRDKYGGWVVVLERNNLAIVNPDPNMFIMENDLMWVLGGQKMGEELLEDGLITSN